MSTTGRWSRSITHPWSEEGLLVRSTRKTGSDLRLYSRGVIRISTRVLESPMTKDPLGGTQRVKRICVVFKHQHAMVRLFTVTDHEKGLQQALRYAIASIVSIEVTLFPRMTCLRYKQTFLAENSRSCNVQRCQSDAFVPGWFPLGHRR